MAIVSLIVVIDVVFSCLLCFLCSFAGFLTCVIYSYAALSPALARLAIPDPTVARYEKVKSGATLVDSDLFGFWLLYVVAAVFVAEELKSQST